MFAKLVSHGSLCQGQEIALEEFPFVFGRGTDVSLQLDDRWVSRRHCQIEAIDGQLLVRDLGSTHGTLLNNRPVGEAALQPGDRLTVGLTCFRVCFADPGSHSGLLVHRAETEFLSTAG